MAKNPIPRGEGCGGSKAKTTSVYLKSENQEIFLMGEGVGRLGLARAPDDPPPPGVLKQWPR